jgi:excisionase family DNA binding protein
MANSLLTAGLPETTRGLTTRELARYLRISPDRVRAMIASGELGAINTSATKCSRARYVVLPEHLAAWVRQRAAGPAPRPPRRTQRIALVDFYPD